ncbi:hypothetical protein [Saccharothrix deserti]|uniref:hypothetical protein n=1 Tax=Saccharothrix deserti TaxID=2593674 RepID=UPI00131EB70B|nr:hypothetical protein [Saccharothrix deserti]
MAAVVLLSLFGPGSTANAATGLTFRGDFSWNSTAMKRYAVCAFVAYENNNETGSRLTRCDGAGSNSKYDSLQGWAGNPTSNGGVLIDAQRVGYQGGKCPTMRGYAYIKCYYLGGKGAPVMTVSASSNANFAGGTALVSWYYQ